MMLTKFRYASIFFVIASFFSFNSVSFAQTINAGSDSTICIGDSIKLGGSPVATGNPVSFSWTSSSSASPFSTDSTPIVSPTSTIDYYLRVFYSNTTILDTINVTVIKLKADFG
ncbi:MAG: hypothetical protein P8I31_06370, partial [Bacteroidia bacterium]|nr:hypothetical protein [Bacteroidia bacterium]